MVHAQQRRGQAVASALVVRAQARTRFRKLLFNMDSGLCRNDAARLAREVRCDRNRCGRSRELHKKIVLRRAPLRCAARVRIGASPLKSRRIRLS